mmetsp:Transcript_63738/g.152431  ORF Transcript_63738/g.152431 Transcript_63738/m.152431 type:complete len:486 (-) Transcript_63738:293-1750(-)
MLRLRRHDAPQVSRPPPRRARPRPLRLAEPALRSFVGVGGAQSPLKFVALGSLQRAVPLLHVMSLARHSNHVPKVLPPLRSRLGGGPASLPVVGRRPRVAPPAFRAVRLQRRLARWVPITLEVCVRRVLEENAVLVDLFQVGFHRRRVDLCTRLEEGSDDEIDEAFLDFDAGFCCPVAVWRDHESPLFLLVALHEELVGDAQRPAARNRQALRGVGDVRALQQHLALELEVEGRGGLRGAGPVVLHGRDVALYQLDVFVVARELRREDAARHRAAERVEIGRGKPVEDRYPRIRQHLDSAHGMVLFQRLILELRPKFHVRLLQEGGRDPRVFEVVTHSGGKQPETPPGCQLRHQPRLVAEGEDCLGDVDDVREVVVRIVEHQLPHRENEVPDGRDGDEELRRELERNEHFVRQVAQSVRRERRRVQILGAKHERLAALQLLCVDLRPRGQHDLSSMLSPVHLDDLGRLKHLPLCQSLVVHASASL